MRIIINTFIGVLISLLIGCRSNNYYIEQYKILKSNEYSQFYSIGIWDRYNKNRDLHTLRFGIFNVDTIFTCHQVTIQFMNDSISIHFSDTNNDQLKMFYKFFNTNNPDTLKKQIYPIVKKFISFKTYSIVYLPNNSDLVRFYLDPENDQSLLFTTKQQTIDKLLKNKDVIQLDSSWYFTKANNPLKE